MVVRLLIMVLNWRSNFQTCPLLQQAGGRRVSRRDSVLAGADVCNSFSSLVFPCWLPQRGFFASGFHDLSEGSQVAVVVWPFPVRRILDADLTGTGPT